MSDFNWDDHPDAPEFDWDKHPDAIRGKDGAPGRPGKDGRDAVSIPGSPGKDGAPGRDGRGIRVFTQKEEPKQAFPGDMWIVPISKDVLVKQADGSWVSIRGERGWTGFSGGSGSDGPIGPPGPAGAPTSLSAIGSSPNANAATLTGAVLNLEPASASFGGVVTTGAQSFAGDKTFTGAISASNLSGTNTGDVTLVAVGAVPNANAASLSGQALTLQPASASFPGLVTTGAQSFAGNKTFTGSITASNLSGTNTGDANQYSISSISGNTSAVNGTSYLCDTTGAAFNVTLPAPANGAWVEIIDATGQFGTNQLTVVRNGSEKIQGIASSYLLYAPYGASRFVSNGTDWFIFI